MPRKTLRFGNKVAMLVQSRNGGYLSSTNNQLRPLGALAHDLEPELLQFENAIFQLVCGDGEVTPEITRNRLGEEIIFGQTVRLLHVTSSSLVCENRRVRASLEKANHKITLERFSSPDVQSSRWRILPRYKVRSEGQKVCDKDVIILRSMSGDSYLHIASLNGGTNSDQFHEANASSSATGFSLEAYDMTSADPSLETQLLSCGDCLQLLHREERSMVACVSNKDVILSPLRISGVEAQMNLANMNSNLLQQQQNQQNQQNENNMMNNNQPSANATTSNLAAASVNLQLHQKRSGSSAATNSNNINNAQDAAIPFAGRHRLSENNIGIFDSTGNEHEFPSSSLFVIEQEDVFAGGPVLFGRQKHYRLKSLLSNHYLCLELKKTFSPANNHNHQQHHRRNSSPSKNNNNQQQYPSSLADQAAQRRKNRRRRASMMRNNAVVQDNGFLGGGGNLGNNNNNNAGDLLGAGVTFSAADFDLNDEQLHDLPYIVDDYELTLTTDTKNSGTLICFWQAADDTSPVARNHSRVFIEFPMLKNGAGLWLCSGFSIPSPPTQKFSEADDIDLRLYIQAKQLLCASVVPQKDGIEILKVPPEVFQDLNFVVSLMPPFERLRQALELFDKKDPRMNSSTISLHLVEQVRENLALLITHCTKSRETNPLLREGTPDFTAQCRIAEQNLVPILLDIIELSLDGPLDGDSFTSPGRNTTFGANSINPGSFNPSTPPQQQQQPRNTDKNDDHHHQLDINLNQKHPHLHSQNLTGEATLNNLPAAALLNLGNNLGDTRYHHQGNAIIQQLMKMNAENEQHHHQQQQQKNQNSNQQEISPSAALGRTTTTESCFLNTTFITDLIALQNSLTSTIKLCFRLIRQVAVGNERTSDSFAPHLNRIFEYCPLSRLGVKDALYEIFKNHPSLVDRPDDLTLVARTIDLVKREGRGSGGSTKLLSAMCTCNNRGLPASQNLVGEELLRPAVEELVYGNPTQFSAIGSGGAGSTASNSNSPSKLLSKNLKPGLVSENFLQQQQQQQEQANTKNSASSRSSNRHSCPFYRLWFKSKADQIREKQLQQQELLLQRQKSNDSLDPTSAAANNINNNMNKRKRRNSNTAIREIDPDSLPCGVFIDMHNINKIYNKTNFSMSNVFEEFQQSETQEGVPIETFCAIAFGKMNSHHHNNRKSGGARRNKNYDDMQSDRTSLWSEGPLSSAGYESETAASNQMFGFDDNNNNTNNFTTNPNSNPNPRLKKRQTLSHVQGLARQLSLLAACCTDQNEKNILYVHELVPLDALLEIVRLERLPGLLRAEAFNLITHAYLAVPGRRNLTEELQSVVHVLNDYQGKLEKKLLYDDNSNNKDNKGNKDGEADNLNASVPRQIQSTSAGSSESNAFLNHVTLLDDHHDKDGGSDLLSYSKQIDSSSASSSSSNHSDELEDDEERLRSTFSRVKTKIHHRHHHHTRRNSRRNKKQLMNSTSAARDRHHQNNNNSSVARHHHHHLSATSNQNMSSTSLMMMHSPAKHRVALDTTIIIDENEINKKLAEKAKQELKEEVERQAKLAQQQKSLEDQPLLRQTLQEQQQQQKESDDLHRRNQMNDNNVNNMFKRMEIESRMQEQAEAILTQFIPLLQNYLSRRKAMVLQDKFETECIHSAVTSLCALIRFGWIPRPEFVKWLEVLTPILDGRDDIGPSHLRNYDRYAYDEQNHVVMECKLRGMEAVNLLATIIRGDIVDRIVSSFEAGKQIPYVSEILDFRVGSDVHRRSLALLMKREERNDDEANDADSKDGIIGELHAFKDLTTDLGLGVLEAVGVDQVVKKLGKLIEEETDSSKNPLSYFSELVDVLLDNALYEYEPVVAASCELLLDLTNTAAALDPMMRRVQILPSAEAVKFYENVKPLQITLSKFESATISAADISIISQTIAKLTQLLTSDPDHLPENHKIVANMRLHVVVANLLEGIPLAFVNAVLIDKQQEQDRLEQQYPVSNPRQNRRRYHHQKNQNQNQHEDDDASGESGSGAAVLAAYSLDDEFAIHVTGASNANVLSTTPPHGQHHSASSSHHPVNRGATQSPLSPLSPKEQRSSHRPNSVVTNDLGASSAGNRTLDRGDSFLAAAQAMDRQHQQQQRSVSPSSHHQNKSGVKSAVAASSAPRNLPQRTASIPSMNPTPSPREQGDFSPSFILTDDQRRAEQLNLDQQHQQQYPSISANASPMSGGGVASGSKLRQQQHPSLNMTNTTNNNPSSQYHTPNETTFNAIDGNILAQAAAATFAQQTSQQRNQFLNNPNFFAQQQQQQYQRSPNNNNIKRDAEQGTSNKISRDTSRLIQVAYRFLLAMLSVKESAHEIQSDLIPFITIFSNQLPICPEIIASVLTKMFYGRIDICTSVQESAIQDIASMILSCNFNPLVAHVLRILIYQEGQKAFDLIQSNSESILRSLLETDGLGRMLRCRDYFTGKHAVNFIRDALSNMNEFFGASSSSAVDDYLYVSMNNGTFNARGRGAASPRNPSLSPPLLATNEIMMRFELLQTICYCLQCSNIDSLLKSEARIALFGDSVVLDDLPFAIDLPAFISTLFLQIFTVAYLEDPSTQIQFVENPNFIRILRRLDARMRKMIERIATSLIDEDIFGMEEEDDDDGGLDSSPTHRRTRRNGDSSAATNILPHSSKKHNTLSGRHISPALKRSQQQKRRQGNNQDDDDGDQADENQDNNKEEKKRRAHISHAADVVVMLDDNNEALEDNAMTIFNNRKIKSPKAGLFSSEAEWYWLINGVVPFLQASLNILGSVSAVNTSASVDDETSPGRNNNNNIGDPQQQASPAREFSPARAALFGATGGAIGGGVSSILTQLKIAPEVFSRLKNISQHAYQLLDVAVRENINFEAAKSAAEALRSEELKQQQKEEEEKKKMNQQKQGGNKMNNGSDSDDDNSEEDTFSDDSSRNVNDTTAKNNNNVLSDHDDRVASFLDHNDGGDSDLPDADDLNHSGSLMARNSSQHVLLNPHQQRAQSSSPGGGGGQEFSNPSNSPPGLTISSINPSSSSDQDHDSKNTTSDSNKRIQAAEEAARLASADMYPEGDDDQTTGIDQTTNRNPLAGPVGSRNQKNDTTIDNDDNDDDDENESTQVVFIESTDDLNASDVLPPSSPAPPKSLGGVGLPPLSPSSGGATNQSNSASAAAASSSASASNQNNYNNNYIPNSTPSPRIISLQQSAILKPGESTQTIIAREENNSKNNNNNTTTTATAQDKTFTGTSTSTIRNRKKIATTLRSPSCFFFMEPSSYDPDSVVSVRTLPQHSIKNLFDFVARTFRQGRLEFLHSEDLKSIHDVVLNLDQATANAMMRKNSKRRNSSTTTAPHADHHHKNKHDSDSADDDDFNDDSQSSSSPSSAIYVFTEWLRAINLFSLGSEGTLESSAYRTTARVILRKGLVGHNAIKNMIRLVNSSVISEHNRSRLLMMLKQVISAADDNLSEATLVVSDAAFDRNLKMSLLSQKLQKHNQHQLHHNHQARQSFDYQYTEDNRLTKKVTTSSSSNVDKTENNGSSGSVSSSASSVSWEMLKHTLSLRLTFTERQDILAMWTGEFQLGPKLVTLLSSSNKKTILAALQCGNALLLDGNKNVQETIYNFFLSVSKEDFFVYCRRFFVICRDQIRDRRRTLKRWIDELQVATRNHHPNHNGKKHQQQKCDLKSNINKKNNNKKTSAGNPHHLHQQQNLESIINSMELIEGLYDFTLPHVLLRFIQLLCEGHNYNLQSYLRFQGDNQVSINVIESIIAILEELAANVDHGTFDLTMQTLAALIELVQGPCVENQKFLISQNIGGIISTIFDSSHPLLTKDQLWTLQTSCVTLLLALQEGHLDLDIMSTLIQSLDMVALVRCMDKTHFLWKKMNHDYFFGGRRGNNNYHPDDNTNKNDHDANDSDIDDDTWGRDKDGKTGELKRKNRDRRKLLGHVGNFATRGFNLGLDFGRTIWRGLIVGEEKRKKNEFEDELNLSCGIFIFMKTMLDVSLLYPRIEPHQVIADKNGNTIRDLFHDSSSYKELSTIVSSVELLRNGSVERVYFRVPEICKTNLQEGSKKRLIQEVDRTGDGGRLADFHERLFNLLNELDFYDKMRKTRGLSVIYHYSDSLDWLALIVSFAINFLMLAYISFENIQDNPDSHFPPGLPSQVYFGLGVTLCVLQSALFINFWFGSLRVYLNEQWQLWQEDLNKEAIKTSKANLSIEPPRIEDNPKSGLFKHEVFLYNAYFILSWARTYQYIFFLIFAFFGVFFAPYWFCFAPLSVIWKFPQLTTVGFAVSRNRLSLALTFLLLVVVIYAFSVAAYFLFSDMFDEDNTGFGGNCDTLLRCFSTSLMYGLLSGGGLNEVTKAPIYTSPRPQGFYLRLIFDVFFFVLLIVLLLNLVFGVILSTFEQLREERDSIESDQNSKCFICGLSRGELDKVSGFEHHITYEHNMWSYLFYMRVCSTKPVSELTGSESHVRECMLNHSPAWFPIGRSVSVDFAERFSSLGNNNNSNTNNSKHLNNNDVSGGSDEGNGNDRPARDENSAAAKNYYNQYVNSALQNMWHPGGNQNNDNNHNRPWSAGSRPGSASLGKVNAAGGRNQNFVAFNSDQESDKKRIVELEQKINRMEGMLEKLTNKLLADE